MGSVQGESESMERGDDELVVRSRKNRRKEKKNCRLFSSLFNLRASIRGSNNNTGLEEKIGLLSGANTRVARA